MRRPALVLLIALEACRAASDLPATPPAPAVPGIVTVPARTQEVTDTVRAFGTVVGDGERSEVRDARTQLAEAEARATLAAKQTARLQDLTRGGVAPEKELEVARAERATAGAAVESARAALAAFGNASPAAALAGNEIWVIAEVPQDDVGSVGRGASVTFETKGPGGPALAGRVEAAATYVSPTTRTAPVRLRLRDPAKLLHPGMTGTAAITTGAPRLAVVVPMDAVLQAGDASVVILETAPGRYVPRQLEVGATQAGWTEIRTGLEVGVRVVTTGAASVLSATRLRAGGE
jgi:multidrug efflux pump subunit AcrA (membrane-fusion protein)